MTIEERAKAYASGKFDEISSTAGYIKGATEQKAIDKRNIIDYVHQVLPNYKDDQSMLWFLEDLLKVMEEDNEDTRR